MLYFIPAWYQNNTFMEHEQLWYRRRMHTEFDDTVKHIQLFNRNTSTPYSIILLSYAPNFRHFLHRQGVFHAPFWSAFDTIQDVKSHKVYNLSYHDLAWPDDTEFIYTPFAIVAMREHVKFAQIEFGEDGNPIIVDIYKDGVICRRNIYDDRGFVSGSIVYEGGIPRIMDYLTEEGIYKCRYFYNDGHVEINPQLPTYSVWPEGDTQTFLKTTYAGMEELLTEVLDAFLQHTSPGDIFCEAVDVTHQRMLDNLLSSRKRILSFYGDRYNYREHSEAKEQILNADAIIADTKMAVDEMIDFLGEDPGTITDITPYDTRVDVGISDQLLVKNILMPVDGLPNEKLRSAITLLAEYMEEHSAVRVHLFTRRADNSERLRLIQIACDTLKESGFSPLLAMEHTAYNGENVLDNEDGIVQKIYVDQCVSELEVSRCMKEQRVFLELRDKPELYLQVMCVSMGIPQISAAYSQFLESGGNGTHIEDLDEILQALDRYLKSLKNWNNAHIRAYEIGRNYTTEVLLNKWKEVLDRLGEN